MTTVAPVDARHALLAGLIDHAPTFPPAQLPLDEALAEHAAARAGETAWMVNRFVVRASQLADLPADDPPRLSVVMDRDWPDVLAGVDDPRIEAFEFPHALLDVPAGFDEIYVETAPGTPLRSGGLRAKIRCGGATVPSVAELAAFVRDCKRLALPFKATAGLHHAVRTDTEHGLCNLLAAVLFDDEDAAVAEHDPGQFWLTGDEFGWRDRTASIAEIAHARRTRLVSVGSCSFTEPVDDLRALGLL